MTTTTRSYAFLSAGKLHLTQPGGEPREVESKFARQVRERSIQIQRRNSWKSQGVGARFMGMGGAGWAPDPEATVTQARVGGLSAVEGGAYLYAVETPDICGVFRLDPVEGEQRLFHSNERRVNFLTAGHGMIACAVEQLGGVTNLALMGEDGGQFTEITEGDSVDTAPSWSRGSQRELVYQSAGIARDAGGFAVGVGPSAVHKLDWADGRVSVLAEDPAKDFLSPQLAGDGTLYAIRRPHVSVLQRPLWRMFLDGFLIPFRLLQALFHWLNFFSVRYSGKPLTGGGPGDQRQKVADIRKMMVWGNLIDADKAARESKIAGDEVPALVPQSWELVRKRAGGGLTVLAKGVISFDLCDDGTLLYTNGSGVYHLADGGAKRLIGQGSKIEHIVATR